MAAERPTRDDFREAPDGLEVILSATFARALQVYCWCLDRLFGGFEITWEVWGRQVGSRLFLAQPRVPRQTAGRAWYEVDSISFSDLCADSNEAFPRLRRVATVHRHPWLSPPFPSGVDIDDRNRMAAFWAAVSRFTETCTSELVASRTDDGWTWELGPHEHLVAPSGGADDDSEIEPPVLEWVTSTDHSIQTFLITDRDARVGNHYCEIVRVRDGHATGGTPVREVFGYQEVTVLEDDEFAAQAGLEPEDVAFDLDPETLRRELATKFTPGERGGWGVGKWRRDEVVDDDPWIGLPAVAEADAAPDDGPRPKDISDVAQTYLEAAVALTRFGAKLVDASTGRFLKPSSSTLPRIRAGVRRASSLFRRLHEKSQERSANEPESA